MWQQQKMPVYRLYCWWLKSCTTWDVYNLVNNGRNHLPTGAGFQPSTVWVWLEGKDMNYRSYQSFRAMLVWWNGPRPLCMILMFNPAPEGCPNPPDIGMRRCASLLWWLWWLVGCWSWTNFPNCAYRLKGNKRRVPPGLWNLSITRWKLMNMLRVAPFPVPVTPLGYPLEV